MEIKIRKIEPDDVSEVATLLKQEWLFHAENTRSFSHKAITDRDISSWVRDRIFKPEGFHCLVAESDNQIQGVLLYRLMDAISIAVNPRVLKVEDIFVRSDARGKGVARYLMEGIEVIASEEGIVELVADVYMFNDGGRNLIEKTGYTAEYVSYMKLLDNKKTPSTAFKKRTLDRAKLYTDGGSRGNPGPSAGGYVILDMENNVVKSNGKYLGITTNNQAEYHSLKGGVEMAIQLGVQELDVYMDSLLVINQMKGIFKIRNRDLWPIHDAIKTLLPRFKNITFTHVPRELNGLADAMVNETLDAQNS